MDVSSWQLLQSEIVTKVGVNIKVGANIKEGKHELVQIGKRVHGEANIPWRGTQFWFVNGGAGLP